MIDAWLEPDEDDDFEEYEPKTYEDIDDDDRPDAIDYDEQVDRALRAIEQRYFDRQGLLYG